MKMPGLVVFSAILQGAGRRAGESGPGAVHRIFCKEAIIMQDGENRGHGFTLMDRSHAEITGVSDVDCFNEQLVVLITSLGSMTISGSNLNISHLNKEDGRLIVDGEFDSIEYSGRKGAKGGFFSRLMR